MNDQNVSNNTEIPKKKRGFAIMSPERVRELASRGGKACQAQGKGHKFTSEEARVAGRLGAIASHAAYKRRKEAASSPVQEG